MDIGVLAETGEHERRVSLTPSGARALYDAGHAVAIESGAGVTSGFPDQAYVDVGADIGKRGEVIDGASVVITVNGPDESALQLVPWSAVGSGHVVVGLHDPLARPARRLLVAQVRRDVGHMVGTCGCRRAARVCVIRFHMQLETLGAHSARARIT